MSCNFDCVTEYAKNRPHSRYADCALWKFSPSIVPHGRSGRGYTDTTAVPIAITHTTFKYMREKLLQDCKLDGAVVGLDLPIWFNLSSSDRVMIIAQDPLRNPKWYHECNAAICSSPFGQHSREHRDSGKGGRRIKLLIEALINKGYGIYLTDAFKYFIGGWRQDKPYEALEEGTRVHVPSSKDTQAVEAYQNLLNKEIEIIQPSVIVALGSASKKALKAILPNGDSRIISLPHFSGAAQGRILRSDIYKDIKTLLRLKDDSIESQANVFAHAIINKIEI